MASFVFLIHYSYGPEQLQLLECNSYQTEYHLLIDIGYYHLTSSIPSVIQFQEDVWFERANSCVLSECNGIEGGCLIAEC